MSMAVNRCLSVDAFQCFSGKCISKKMDMVDPQAFAGTLVQTVPTQPFVGVRDDPMSSIIPFMTEVVDRDFGQQRMTLLHIAKCPLLG